MKTALRFLMMFSLMMMALAGIAQAQEETAVPDEVLEVEAGVITFLFPAALAEVQVSDVEAVPMEDGMPYFAAYPAHVRVDFANFNGETDLIFPPFMVVMPTADMEAFGEEDYMLAGRTAALTAYLEEQPELEASGLSMASPDAALPFVPILNAAQVFYAQPETFEFEGGSGLRYLTYYSQSVDLITEGWVFYTFQGLTDDGEYVIAAVIPVDTGLLPEPAEVDYDDLDYDAFAENYETYLNELIVALAEQPAEDFSPPLETLDAIMESIVVNEE